MTSPVALIDATGHDEHVPADLQVAGLGLVERTLRLAAVAGCEHALVLHRPDGDQPVLEGCRRFARDDRYAMSLEPVAASDPAAPLADLEAHLDRRRRPETTLLALASTRVYERGPVQQLVDAHRPGTGLSLPAETDTPAAIALDASTSLRLVDLRTDAEAAPDRPLPDELLDRADLDRLPIRRLDEVDAGWWIDVESPDDASRAEERIWQGCIKSIDGPVSRHLNRPASLACSRRLAPTDVTPNQMSAVTFAVGLAATAAVAAGGYWWFLAGTLLYQLSSILDGVDGELARGKYEFSTAGEWIDTLGDNFKDIFFYLGLGYGAYQTVPVAAEFGGPELWLWLGTLAATGKFLSLAGYATWLIPRGRGCVLIFDWGDEQDSEPEGLVPTLVANLDVLTKNDVVIFAAFALAVPGLLHWFLAVMAVGHHFAAAAIFARLASPEVEIVPEPAPEPEREPVQIEN